VLVNPETRRSVGVEWTDATLTVRDVYLAVSLNNFHGATPGIKRDCSGTLFYLLRTDSRLGN
jgi:hypothetical protein